VTKGAHAADRAACSFRPEDSSLLDADRFDDAPRFISTSSAQNRHGNNADGWSSVVMLGFLANNSGDCYAVHLRKR
jgi:hypothetical protein